MTSRNPIARVIRSLRKQVVPDKRYEQLERSLIKELRKHKYIEPVDGQNNKPH